MFHPLSERSGKGGLYEYVCVCAHHLVHKRTVLLCIQLHNVCKAFSLLVKVMVGL